ncbi:MAG: HesA/MoeB/ThiF family protein [Candidatus Thorarchaeota archaeon]
MTLTETARQRYSRFINLYDMGESAMESIIGTSVVVVGAGGLGSPALRLLASLGFGKIRIIDGDRVELTNLPRQHLYNAEDVGKPKAQCAAKNLRRLNPEVEVETIEERLTDDNATDLIRGCNIIVDGLDSFQARRAVNRASLKLRVPYVFAGAVEYFANLSTFVPGKTACFSCIMGGAQDRPEYTAAVRGVDPCLLSMAAGIEVREAVLLATKGKSLLQGKLLTLDTSTMSLETFTIRPNEHCPSCGSSDTEE